MEVKPMRFLPLLALCLPLDAQQVLILHKTANSLGVYEHATGKNLANIAVGVKPHEFALSPDERFAYVTNYGADSYTETQPGGNTISIVDLKQRKNIGEIELGEFHRPHGIERSRSGLYYVTTDFPPALLVVDAAARRVRRVIRLTAKLPHMVQLSHDETRAWTADSGSGTLTSIGLDSGTEEKKFDVGGVPMGFALSRDGTRLYAATRSNDSVWVLDAKKNELIRQIAVPGNPVRLLLANKDTVLLASLIEAGAVAVIDTQTLKEVRRFPAGARAEGLQIDPDGRHAYVSAQGDNFVLRLSLGDFRPQLKIPTAAKPDPIHVIR
jgi:YVTN family beta-propeller protein